MLYSINDAIQRIELILPNTAAYKASKLTDILCRLKATKTTPDLNLVAIQELELLVRSLLIDPEFTYKRISLFGLCSSKSEQFARDLIALLQNSYLLALEKINRQYSEFEDYRILLASRNYLALFNGVCLAQLNENFKAPVAAQIAQQWLTVRLEERIKLPRKENNIIYRVLLYPMFEINKNQRTYTINEVIDIVSNSSHNKSVSFTYAVDLNRNIIFSLGANTSFHYNLCQGANVYGAGEVHLRNIDGRVYLNIVNNRSGLYKPGTELLDSVKHAFGKNQVEISNTKLIDEAEALADIHLRAH